MRHVGVGPGAFWFRYFVMPTSMEDTRDLALGESVSRLREMSRPSEGEKVSLTQLLVEACEDTGLSEKDAARSQGYDPKYWPRIKSGEKAAHLDRIEGLPETTQRAFVARFARQLRMRVTDEQSPARALAELVECAARVIREIA